MWMARTSLDGRTHLCRKASDGKARNGEERSGMAPRPRVKTEGEEKEERRK